MHITIDWHDKAFNINLHSKEGNDAFLSIKGCRIVGEGDSAFIGFPARKNEQTNKWWNHVWGSDSFQKTVIDLALKAKPQSKPAEKKSGIDQMDDDIPFANPYRSFLQSHVV